MFGNIDLQEVCNLIILISAVIIAVKNIYGFLKKPVDDLHDRSLTAEEKRIEKVLNSRVPEILSKCAMSMKEEQRNQLSSMEESIKKCVVNAVEDKVEELKEITLDQGQEIKQIQKAVNLINEAQMDVMRLNMNQIYYKYRPYKKILDCDKKAFMKIYNDYHSMGGNTWIDMLHAEVITWEIVEDETELKVDN